MPSPNEKIELRIPDIPLEGKLDLVAATIAAIYEAHRDTMSARSWRCMHEAQDKIMEAMLAIEEDEKQRFREQWLQRVPKHEPILKLDVPKSV